MAEQITALVEMERFRCPGCNRYFMVERGSPHPCPACLQRELDVSRSTLRDVRGERDEAFEKHRRQVSALKGAITKAKSR